ncbi:S8 family serine peptidase [Spirillospora sp. NPDC048911]|uniref:S8 family serine peptidase n=1 Tax=Spirillospora sp. NPDC048911 TaxID=3364527 RepID=UPI003710A29D
MALVLLTPMPATGAPKPRKELYWFDWWELEKKVWPITMGEGVTVAVIDDEVNRGLPDLQGAVLPNIGMDAVRVKPDRENGGHGTAMTALIVGQGRGTGMVGVAPRAKVLPLVAYFDDGWAKAIRYAADHGVKVVNMSRGSAAFQPCEGEVQDSISYAVKRDVVVVVSAGNEGRRGGWRSFPANCAGVLAVGGLDGHVRPWSESTPGEYVMVAAPSVEAGSIDGGGQFEWRGHAGTSQAAALTSGVVALVRSKYPKMPAREVVQRLLATSRDVGKPGWDDVTGYGLVRPYRALVDKVPTNAPNPIYDNGAHQKASVKPPGVRPSAEKRTSVPTSTEEQVSRDKWVLPAMGVVGIAVILVLAGYGLFRKSKKA